MYRTHHRTVTVDGNEVFYREAGPADAPIVLLLHGFPTSSYMFRHLIPQLSHRYHVIAPDHIGFGRSSAPPVADFAYTFDALAAVTMRLLEHLGIDNVTIYVQDYGAPIGWRLAVTDPSLVNGVITQNGNAYESGFVEEFWEPIWRYAQNPRPDSERALRGAFSPDAVRWQYTHGVEDVSLIDPDTWEHDLVSLARPGNDDAQLHLFADYPSNRVLYPRVHAWLRRSQVPVLAIWGRNDQIFAPAGATAFSNDVPAAEIHLLDGGHFLLESHLDEVANAILAWRATF